MARRPPTVGLLTFLTAFLVVPDAGAEEAVTGWDEETGIYVMVFPVEGDNFYDDSFGACRGSGCSRRHKGIDIMAEKMTPVVAAAAGTVGWILDQRGGRCCALAIDHDDGWRTWYIHMNNDTPGTDDGEGWGFADGIESGVRVAAGQRIGYVGDSGNAEETPPHIHFELQRPDGTEINPYDHLRDAEARSLEGGIRFTGDDVVDVFINGVAVASSDEWKRATTLPWTFEPGDVVAVRAGDTGGDAGFLAEVAFGGGTAVSNSGWRLATNPQPGWQESGFDDSDWDKATAYGVYGAMPWGTAVSGFSVTSEAEWIWSAGDDEEIFLRYVIAGPPQLPLTESPNIPSLLRTLES